MPAGRRGGSRRCLCALEIISSNLLLQLYGPGIPLHDCCCSPHTELLLGIITQLSAAAALQERRHTGEIPQQALMLVTTLLVHTLGCSLLRGVSSLQVKPAAAAAAATAGATTAAAGATAAAAAAAAPCLTHLAGTQSGQLSGSCMFTTRSTTASGLRLSLAQVAVLA